MPRPSALAKSCCTRPMLLNPSVLFFCLSASLMPFRVDAVVVVACARQRLPLPPSPLPSASRAPVNFVVLPPASCLDYYAMHCGKAILLLLFSSRSSAVPACSVSGCPCLALSLWEFPLPLRSPKVFRGLVSAEWSVYTPCVSFFLPYGLLKSEFQQQL